jgi:hypothetical protein
LESARFDFSDRFQSLTRGEIAKCIGPDQVHLLRQFFGTGLAGAQVASQQFQVPAALKRESLEAYHEIARRVIMAGQDGLGVQRLRLRLVERALELMGGTPE